MQLYIKISAIKSSIYGERNDLYCNCVKLQHDQIYKQLPETSSDSFRSDIYVIHFVYKKKMIISLHRLAIGTKEQNLRIPDSICELSTGSFHADTKAS